MGYNTIFEGELLFTVEPTVKMINKLNSLFGEDCRDHPEWGVEDLTYIDLRLTKNSMGIEWDSDTEKTYDLDGIVNFVIREMRKEWPDFGLKGVLSAQGEDSVDKWYLTIGEDGWAKKVKRVADIKHSVKCPYCLCTFNV